MELNWIWFKRNKALSYAKQLIQAERKKIQLEWKQLFFSLIHFGGLQKKYRRAHPRVKIEITREDAANKNNNAYRGGNLYTTAFCLFFASFHCVSLLLRL